jgi:hypothetical protein
VQNKTEAFGSSAVGHRVGGTPPSEPLFKRSDETHLRTIIPIENEALHPHRPIIYILLQWLDICHSITPNARSTDFDLPAVQGPAARLEAMAWSEPELGNPRRPELGLAKAMAGTGKGIWTFKGELLPRVALNGSQDADPAGSELVLSLIRDRAAPECAAPEWGRAFVDLLP